ncbi:hypothetical protein K438DRAFT_1789817 [Mycena galopus ATCC 62051]|nr:hypothetical protein K438DRAFT_1789817 [Mycena galopus ATCC 62051]
MQPEQLPRGEDESDIGWDINNYAELNYRSAVSMFLNAIGGCVFAVDNIDFGAWNNTPSPDGGIKVVYSNTSLCSEPHLLVIAPGRADVNIELDYFIYTVDVKNPRVGAIIGDVIGGIAVLALNGTEGETVNKYHKPFDAIRRENREYQQRMYLQLGA